MINIEESRRTEFLNKMKATEEMVKRTQDMNKQEQVKKTRINTMKMKDREENVRRIEKMNEYHREKIMDKIEVDNERAENIRQEREQIMQMRSNLRKKVDREKEGMMEVFEKAKKKGKLDSKDLKGMKHDSGSIERNYEYKKTVKKAKKNKNIKKNSWEESPRLGEMNLIYDKPKTNYKKQRSIYDMDNDQNVEFNENNYNEEQAIRNVNELRTKLHNELMQELEKEQERENERDEILKNVTHLLYKQATEDEKKRLDKMFGIERAKASERIVKISK